MLDTFFKQVNYSGERNLKYGDKLVHARIKKALKVLCGLKSFRSVHDQTVSGILDLTNFV